MMLASVRLSGFGILTSSRVGNVNAWRLRGLFASDPEVFLLDEPTSALDVSVQAEILNLLTDLRAGHSLTYPMVSHDLAVIGHICSDIAVMQLGEIVETLTVDDMRAIRTRHPYTQHLLESSLLGAVGS